MSRLLDFYRGEAADSEGRFLADVLAWDDDALEWAHDWVQWLFPLPEPSRFNRDAPLPTEEDMAAFRSDLFLRANLLKSFERFLAFLGLQMTADGQVVEGGNLAARIGDVWAFPNHNWMRISRVLRSLNLLGLAAEGRSLYEGLVALHRRRRFPLTLDTFQHWTEAVERLPPRPPWERGGREWR